MSRVGKKEVIQGMIDLHKRSLDFYQRKPFYKTPEQRDDQRRRVEDRIRYWENEQEKLMTDGPGN